MDTFLSTYDAWQLVMVMGIAMMVGWGFGWFVGQRFVAGDSETERPGLAASKFDSAALGLLALLIGFTFSMSLTRHEHRRAMVVADANAIGDFYQCAGVVSDPVRTDLRHKIRQFTELHGQIARQPYRRGGWEDALRHNQRIQNDIEELVVKAINEGTPIAVPLMQTFNQLTSTSTERVAAAEDLVPPSVVLLLLTFAVVTTTLDGLEHGTRAQLGRIELVVTLSFVVLVILVVYVTLDLNQPQAGFITVNQAPIERLLSAMPK